MNNDQDQEISQFIKDFFSKSLENIREYFEIHSPQNFFEKYLLHNNIHINCWLCEIRNESGKIITSTVPEFIALTYGYAFYESLIDTNSKFMEILTNHYESNNYESNTQNQTKVSYFITNRIIQTVLEKCCANDTLYLIFNCQLMMNIFSKPFIIHNTPILERYTYEFLIFFVNHHIFFDKKSLWICIMQKMKFLNPIECTEIMDVWFGAKIDIDQNEMYNCVMTHCHSIYKQVIVRTLLSHELIPPDTFIFSTVYNEDVGTLELFYEYGIDVVSRTKSMKMPRINEVLAKLGIDLETYLKIIRTFDGY